MDLRSLECAIALAEKGHFGRAATHLNITQPAFSQRIAALEDEIGHKLFIRSKSPVTLTPAGEALVKRAKVVLDNTEAAKKDAKLAAQGLSGSLRIGYTQIALYQKFPEVLSRFRKAFSTVNMELTEKISIQQEQLLMNDELDIGVVHPPLANKELQVQYLDESHLLLAVSNHWPQYNQTTICLSACADLPFILPPRHIGPTFYDGIISACNRAGFTPNIVQEAAPMSTAIGLISSGIGVGFVTEDFSVIKRPGVNFLKVKNRLPSITTALAWRKDANNPLVQHFVESLEPRESANVVEFS